MDVVNAQRDLLAAQRDYARARYDYILNTLRLKQAVGILNVQDLEGINNWLVQYTIELQEEEDNSPLVDTENPLPEPAVTQPDSTITPNEPTP